MKPIMREFNNTCTEAEVIWSSRVCTGLSFWSVRPSDSTVWSWAGESLGQPSTVNFWHGRGCNIVFQTSYIVMASIPLKLFQNYAYMQYIVCCVSITCTGTHTIRLLFTPHVPSPSETILAWLPAQGRADSGGPGALRLLLHSERGWLLLHCLELHDNPGGERLHR